MTPASANHRVVHLTSIASLLQVLQRLESFNANGVKYIISIDSRQIENTLSLSQVQAASAHESHNVDMASLLNAMQ